MEADLIFHSGTVITVDDGFTLAEAAAVRGDRIVATGTTADVRSLAGPATRMVDLCGGSLIPGINDSHLHLQEYALNRANRSLDLGGVTSLAEARRLVAERAAELPAGAWLKGHGWHENRLAGIGPLGPTAADLDDVSGGRPVLLEHFSLHGAWVSSLALERAGLSRSSPDPDGGTIVRDPATSRPTGLLKEAAVRAVQEAVPRASLAERLDATAEAVCELNRRGVTSITDPVVTPPMLRDYLALHSQDRLTVRLTTLLHWSWPSVQTSLGVLQEAMRYVGSGTGLGDDLLRIGGCKLFADGVAALGTAWMSRPYPGGHCGSLVTEGSTERERVESLRALVLLLHRHRFQVQVHATGDRGCDSAVAALAEAMEADPWPEARHVLIHANLPSETSMRTMARHGMVANTNALVKWQAAPGSRSVLSPEDWHRGMPVRSLLEAGVVVADASDAPITDPDWRRALQILVTRTYRGGGADVCGPDQTISRAAALRAWTAAPAYQDHREDQKGSIEVGKLADLVVLAEDLMEVDTAGLPALTPLMTVLGGEVVHED